MLKQNPLFKTANNVDEAISLIKSELSLFDPNQVHALMMMFQNTILKEMGHTCMGVGDGTGDLYIYGKYEAIKAMQDKIFELEDYRSGKKA